MAAVCPIRLLRKRGGGGDKKRAVLQMCGTALLAFSVNGELLQRWVWGSSFIYSFGPTEGGGVDTPHSLFAFGPISSSSKPPEAMSLWLNQG